MGERVGAEQLLARARRGMARLTPEQTWAAMADGARLIDIRSDHQIERGGLIQGALRVPRNVLEWRLDPDGDYAASARPQLRDLVVVVCQQGYQSSLAAATLREMGYARACDVIGGFEAWRARDVPTRR